MWMRGTLAATVVAAVFGLLCSAAFGVTPGWECIPASGNVVSGGTGAAPSCPGADTSVLAPTYVSSGVGGKHTVEFSSVNLQIVDGTGSTSTVNGTGNLVLGYDESPGTQTGSHNLVLGEKQSFIGYSDLVGGYSNTVNSDFDAALGSANKLAGPDGLVAGTDNYVGPGAGGDSVLGGYGNTATINYATILGGCSNAASTSAPTLASLCTSTSYPHGFTAIAGGSGNQVTGESAVVTGGQGNTASDEYGSIVGGCNNVTGSASDLDETCNLSGGNSILGGYENSAYGDENTVSGGDVGYSTGGTASVAGGQGGDASGESSFVGGGDYNEAGYFYASVLGGFENTASLWDASVAGGESNNADGDFSSILGGYSNTITGNCSTFPSTGESCSPAIPVKTRARAR